MNLADVTENSSTIIIIGLLFDKNLCTQTQVYADWSATPEGDAECKKICFNTKL